MASVIWVKPYPILVAWHEMKRRVFFVKNVKTLFIIHSGFRKSLRYRGLIVDLEIEPMLKTAGNADPASAVGGNRGAPNSGSTPREGCVACRKRLRRASTQYRELERAHDKKSTLPTLLLPHVTPHPDRTARPSGPRLGEEGAFTDPQPSHPGALQ